MALMDFVLRALVCACAFAGAGWFGESVATADTWDSSFTWIIVTAVVGGLLVALVQWQRRRPKPEPPWPTG